MGDMEKPLRGAIAMVWRRSVKKICAYHYAKGLFKNIGEKGLRGYYCGRDLNIKVYHYFRNFFGMIAVPPHLIGKCWNLVYKLRKNDGFGFEGVSEDCKSSGNKWLKYHRKQYMEPKTKRHEWNHYRSYVRTNNELENRNGKVNKMFGTHPYIHKFAFQLAKWYQMEYVELQQYINQGYQRQRKNVEILKNNLLDKCWDFIDAKKGHETNEDLVIFLKYASVALKGNKETITRILKRP
eukprot:546460_1